MLHIRISGLEVMCETVVFCLLNAGHIDIFPKEFQKLK
jgi:hypothetical protein